ncbi:RNA-binding protein 39-like isoform X1 [Limulus polyphemus]|uniref:RNA-binding protein 39-like isoform X1 n=1 Tax=Limulus polyphemus TaxID=6850 RepID=A0ABM1BBA3_LIMPO|nr:RNA-binding protein 39-like isoform X1 [Limulus polyphemus]XP_022246382.1 RNA-binding protein 39-like isoform X1 [Limulus polyphemus]
MADDFDIEALLEAPYKRKEQVNGKGDVTSSGGKESRRGSSSSSKRKKRSRSRGRNKKSRSRSRSRRSRSRGRRSRSRDRERRRHSKSRGREHKRKSRSRSPERKHKSKERKKSSSPRNEVRERPPPQRSPLREPNEELSPEERDQRTVFCMQLSQRIRARDLEEFFSAVGKVRDVKLIMDNKTRRSKGIAYVEFQLVESVSLALGLNGQKLLGVPIIVQPTQAEKNRAAASANNLQKGNTGPMRLYVGSLHFNITEDMLKGIFEPFGKIDKIELVRDTETARSKGYGFITFRDSEDAKKALEQLNGFELAGRPMKVGHVTERLDTSQGSSFLDSEELDRTGIDLGATGRLQLMAKLAEGTGFQIPEAAMSALQLHTANAANSQSAPPIATQCFMLSNMFDPGTESNPSWDIEVRNDVIDECRKHGGVSHVYVDKASPQGNVYVKCPTVAAAVASVSALHGRWFAGRFITAAYVPVVNYHGLFPDAANIQASL